METLVSVSRWLTQQRIHNHLTWLAVPNLPDVMALFLTTWYDALPEFSHLLFVEDDMAFPPELVGDMLDFDKPLVGAFYAKRQLPPRMVGAAVSWEESNGFVRADHIGAGVMLIRRDVITTMLEKLPDIVDEVSPSLQALVPMKLKRLIRAFDPVSRRSEDVSFCHRWKQCGGEIWANRKHTIGHIGPHTFTITQRG